MESPNPTGCAPVRTVPLRELPEIYRTQRRRPVGDSDMGNINKIFAIVEKLFPGITADEYDAEKHEKVQCCLIRMKNLKGKPYCRKYLNKLLAFVRCVFLWAARKKIVPYALANELKLVAPIQYGEALHENPDREDASPEAIIATIKHLKERQIIHMLIFQALTGIRPSELCGCKTGEIKQKKQKNGEIVWTFEPYHHKTKWKGKPRSIALGAEEMAILEKYMTGKKADDYLFYNLYNKKSLHISPATYGRYLKKTQEEHGLERFTPYQIRHANGTWISEVLDRDHARAQLGHTTEKMTARYDHSDTKKQKAVIEKRKAVGTLIGDAFEFIAVPPKTVSTAPSYPHVISFPRNSRIFTGE